ncbi:BTAD domain-containing putative transcriptional regulator [Micromonospora sp. CA-263727]|uniref:BTAD domain-containing putative transcriptional regulator n=1 Tax=Micromonospora sp. CA-263727 TaxID=3239967 RepID=UPI003D89FA86
MSRAFVICARTVRALLALAVLAGATIGVPWLMIVAVGWPLDWIGWPHPGAIPSLADLSGALTSPWSDHMLLALLATIGWVLWAQFLRDTTIEIIEALAVASAARRGLHRPRPGRRGPIRWVAAVLVGAVVGAVLIDAARVGTSSPSAAAADAAARRPAMAVSSAHTDTPTARHHGPRSVLTVSTSTSSPAATSTAVPLTAHRNGPAVPDWARDAPGGTHRVVAGDNLWDLAAKHLADPHRWREIYKLNRGHQQANGYALTDPDQIHIGWILALPGRQATPAPAAPGPDVGLPKATEAAPSTPPATVTPTPSSPEPSTPTPPPTAPRDADEAATPAPDTEPSQDEANGEPGIALPAQGWISLSLAVAIAAVAALLRLQRRRRARLTFSPPATIEAQHSPLPSSLACLSAIGSRHLGTGSNHRPAAPAIPASVGIDTDAAEVSLFHLPGPGIALQGSGAIPAARAILAAVLTANATETAVLRPVVVTTTGLLTQLLPEDTPAVGLDPDGTAYDGERLVVLADTAAAITHAEEEMIGRRRLLDSFDAETITDLNTRQDHAETQPPYVLLIESTRRHAARLAAVAAHRTALDLHPVIVGDHEAIPTVELTAEGTVTGDTPYPVARLSTLGAGDLAAILTMLTDTLARPEAGTDVDDPHTNTSPAEASAEATPEPVPAQPDATAALVRLQVLGPVTVATAAGPIATGMRSGSFTILAVLAAHPAGRTLDQLAAGLHPDVDPRVAVKRIRTDITTARRVLRTATGHDESMFIVYDPGSGRYQLDPQAVTVDLWQMLTAINHATTDDEENALAALRRATDLYAGDFAEEHDHAWAADYATSYRHQVLAAYARIAEILEADHPDQAVAALERAADLDPVNEELYQRIMRIHGRQQRPDAVRRTLRRLEERLADLGDAEPSQATRRVAERQLRPVAPISGARS